MNLGRGRAEGADRRLIVIKESLSCFICGARAPWSIWGGEWRPVCRRHFVAMRWDTLSEPDRGFPRHPDLAMAYSEYIEETEKRSARDKDYLASVSLGIR
jgi:hypothetical protein